ncbi:MAG TPA: ABC transporter ATP-binding protein [Acetobacteraceae bacterium]|nr:ABC transporter ATP-binding protein [Acetobacteraceae bacterium]
MAAIAIRGLTKHFGTHAALHGLDLHIEDRQFVTLLGPSGCGKTTTLRLVAGLIEPDAGEIDVGGRVLSSPHGVVPPERRGMGLVFQTYALWPHMTVFDNVAFGLRMQRVHAVERRRRVAAMLDLVGLEGTGGRNPSALSGGQQQRVALARALVTEPGILLLDEPLSNLDAKLRERMRTELKDLQRRTGITFVYVTHDQNEAMALSDRIAVLSAGRLQQYGPPAEIYDRPTNRFVADFMGAANLLDGTSGPGGISLDAGPRLALETATTGRVSVMLRPEDLMLHRSAPGDAPTLPGKIIDCAYLGAITEYHVATSGGMMRVQVHRGSPVPIGEPVWLGLDAWRCVVLPAAPSPASGRAGREIETGDTE